MNTASDNRFPDLITQHVTARYGVHVLELGEDGGTLVALGHHEDRRTLAAFSHYARTVWGDRLNDRPWGLEAPTADEVEKVRAIVVHACELGWSAEDPVPVDELELVDADTRCDGCSRVGANWALLYRADVQEHPAAFPVTVWEYDA